MECQIKGKDGLGGGDREEDRCMEIHKNLCLLLHPPTPNNIKQSGFPQKQQSSGDLKKEVDNLNEKPSYCWQTFETRLTAMIFTLLCPLSRRKA